MTSQPIASARIRIRPDFGRFREDTRSEVDAATAKPGTVKITADTDEAKRRLDALKARRDELGARVVTARVRLDGDRQALDSLARIDLSLRRLDNTTARPKVDLQGVAKAELAVEGLELQLDRLNRRGVAPGAGGAGSGRGGGGLLARFAGANLPAGPGFGLLALGGLAPAAIPLGAQAAGALGGGAAGLLSATVAGGLGAGAFGLGARASFKTVEADVKKLTTLTTQYNNATTDKQRAAVLLKEQQLWSSLDPAQRQAVRNVQGLDASFARFQKRLEPTSSKLLGNLALVADTLLKKLTPAAVGVGGVLDKVSADLNRNLNGPQMTGFFRFVGVEAPLYVDRFLRTAGDLGQGVLKLAEDFNPLGLEVTGKIEGLSAAFDRWASGPGPGKFVAWANREGPQAATTIKNLSSAVVGLGRGLAPIGQVELQALEPTLKFIGELGKQHPQVITDLGIALLGVGAGLKAIKLAQGAAGILSKLPGFGGSGGGLGGVVGTLGKPVPVYVTNWGGGVGGLPGGGGGFAKTAENDAVQAGEAAAGGAAVSKGAKVLRYGKGVLKALPVVGTAVALADVANSYTTGQNKASAARVMALAQSGEPGLRAVEAAYARIEGALAALTKQGASGEALKVTKALADQFKNAILAAGGTLPKAVPYRPVSHEAQTHRHDNILTELSYLLDPTGRSGFGRSMFPGGKFDASSATAQLLRNSPSKAEVAYLKDLGHEFPAVALALQDYQNRLDRSTDAVDRQKSALAQTRGAVLAHRDALAAAKIAIENVNDSIGHEKSSLALLAAAEISHADAVRTVLAELAKVPGALKQAYAQARSGGVTIGQALDDGIKLGVQQKSGAVLLVSEQLIGNVLHVMSKKAQRGSPSKVTTQYGRDIAQGLIVGFGQQLPAVERAFDVGTAKALRQIAATAKAHLGAAKLQLSSDVSARSQYASSLSGQLTSGLSLTSAIGPTGNVGNLAAYIGNYAGQEMTLSRDLTLLRGKHLAAGLLQQIAEAGPAQGVALAASILSGRSGSIANLNRQYAAVGAYANRIGATTADALYGQTVTRDKAMVAALEEIVTLLRKNPREIAAVLDAVVRGVQAHR